MTATRRIRPARAEDVEPLVELDLGRKAEARELLAKLRVLQPDNPDIEKLAEAIGEE